MRSYHHKYGTRTRSAAAWLVERAWFKGLIIGAILGNTLILAMDHKRTLCLAPDGTEGGDGCID